MFNFGKLSIHHKLSLMSLITTSIVMSFATGAFFIYDVRSYRAGVARELTTLVAMITENSAAPLIFENQSTAREVISVLKSEDHILAGYVLLADGSPYSKFQRQPEAQASVPALRPPGVYFDKGKVIAFADIVVDRRLLGVVCIERDTADLEEHIYVDTVISLIALLLGIPAAWLISTRLQKVVSDPIVELSKVARTVASKKSYDVRAAKRSDDELGDLVDQFNIMLEEIQIRDLAVQERTSELQEEIVERKRIEAQLITEKQRAEESNHAKSAFLANMSHELRTPLNAIIGYSELLQEEAVGDLKPHNIGDLEKIRGAGKHLLALINDILDVSKIEAGRIQLNMEWLDIGSLVSDVVNMIDPLVSKNNNRLSLCNLTAGGCTVYADATRLRQSLFNLLSNAAKFTTNGEITFCVSEETREGREFVRWDVRDTGIGIAREDHDKLFHPFTQLDSSASRHYEGTGLGLVITQKFCQLMGAEISLESELGKGATFTIMMPRDGSRLAPQTAVYDGSAAQNKDQRALETNRCGPVVLVADDDWNSREHLGRVLTKAGFFPIFAVDGEEALRIIDEQMPRAIILDLLMPVVGGTDVLRRLRGDPKTAQTPVVVHTVMDTEGLHHAVEADAIFQKPANIQEMMATLRSYVDAGCA